MKRKIFSVLVAFIVVFSLTVTIYAEGTGSTDNGGTTAAPEVKQPVGDKSTTEKPAVTPKAKPVVKPEAKPKAKPEVKPKPEVKKEVVDRNKKALESLRVQLKKLEEQKAALEKGIEAAIVKAKAERDPKIKEEQQKREAARAAANKPDASQDMMNAKDKDELAQIAAEKAKWQEFIAKHKAALQEKLNKIDASSKYAQQKKDAIQNYFTQLDAFWAEKEKLWALKIALAKQRQTIQTEFNTAMAEIQKLEKTEDEANGKNTQKTDYQDLEQKMRANFKSKIDEIVKKIQEIQGKISSLSSGQQ